MEESTSFDEDDPDDVTYTPTRLVRRSKEVRSKRFPFKRLTSELRIRSRCFVMLLCVEGCTRAFVMGVHFSM